MRWFLVPASTVLLCLCLGAVRCASDIGGSDPTLGHVVRELRAELQALQRAREQDRLLLRRLEERLSSTTATTTPSPTVAAPEATHHHHAKRHHEEQRAFARSLRALEHERAALDTLGEQLRRMKLDLNQVVKDRERPVDAEALLRADVDKLQLQLDSLRSEQSDEVSRTAARDRAHRASVDWLRSTMEELKTELAELAKDTNVTAALSLSREFEREASTLRADLSELRNEARALRATQQQQQAREAQATGERAELRVLLQKQAVAQRDLAQQLSELTEDFRNQQVKQRKNKEKTKRHDDVDLEFEGSGLGDTEDQPRTDPEIRDHRHEQHGLRRIVSQLEDTVQALSHNQDKLSKDVTLMRHNDTHLAALVSNMQRSADAIAPFTTGDLDAQLRSLREQVHAQSETIRNVANSVQSVDKVHASTVELFRDIRTLEKKVDRGLSDLRKEVSKSEFDVARALSLAKGAQRDEVARRDSLGTLRADVLRARAELEKNRYKILALENLVLNATVSGRKAGNHWVSQEVKIANLEVGSTRLSKMLHRNSGKLTRLARSLDKVVNRDVLDEWKRQQEDLAKAIRNVTDQVPRLRSNLTRLEAEMGKLEDNLPQDCSAVKDSSRSGVYLIHPRQSATALKVFCDMDTEGGGWTLVQRRRDGSEDFYRTWADYRRGFGSPGAEHWLGNQALHDLTSSANYSLRVDLWDTAGRYKFVEYNRFRVASEAERYRLEVYGYHGNASNALEYHSGMAFSTADRDNDFSSTHCAMYYSSGWWYNHCQYVNINGKYNVGLTWYDMDALEWVQLSRVEMKVRPARTKRKRWTRGKAA
ncbi:protein scabrous [Ixodes scapularis]